MSKKVNIESEWGDVLAGYFATPEFTALSEFVREEYQNKKIYPRPGRYPFS